MSGTGLPQPERSYLVCATPRSGSTLLCEALAASGLAGRPEEYFEARLTTGLPRSARGYLGGAPGVELDALLGGDRQPPAPAYSSLEGLAAYRDHLVAALARGTGDNGAFGAKLMWMHVEDFVPLARTVPGLERRSLRELLEALLPGVRFVWVRRDDTLQQAVSLWTAIQTGAWRSGGGHAAAPEPRYSFAAIDHLRRRVAADERRLGGVVRGARDRAARAPLRALRARPRRGRRRRAAPRRRRAAARAGAAAGAAAPPGRRALGGLGRALPARVRASPQPERGDRLTPPNILYLHSHDTGRYVQPYGHQIPTPNIQLLADQGVLFRKAFSAASTCSGSRAALVTGQYPHSNGMVGLAHRGFELFDYSHHIVHALRRAGYHSELIGEQHISADPAVIGYDRVHEIDNNDVEHVAPRAVDFLRDAPPEPFFLSVGFFETHRNYFEPSSVRDYLYSLPPAGLPDLPPVRQDMAAFKASARTLDQGVGAVLNALVMAGLSEDTLVICTTDHGLAVPAAKATLTDRGLGVMLIVRGPGGFGGGRVCEALVSQLDLYPTICELAGVDTPAFAQGVSLLPHVRRQAAKVRDEAFAELTYHAAYDPQRAIRTDRHRYIRRFSDGELVLANVDDSPAKELMLELGWGEARLDEEQLFDLALDPGEQRNLAYESSHADVREELAERLEAWMRETGDPLLDGDVPAPVGARINTRDQRSAHDEPVVVTGAESLAAASR